MTALKGFRLGKAGADWPLEARNIHFQLNQDIIGETA